MYSCFFLPDHACCSASFLDMKVHSRTAHSSFGSSDGDSEGHAYATTMHQSALCLNLKGMSSECFRFYEALEAGCIPVVINKFTNNSGPQWGWDDIGADQQFRPLLQSLWKKNRGMRIRPDIDGDAKQNVHADAAREMQRRDLPILWMHHPRDLRPIVHTFQHFPQMLDAFQTRMVRWWERLKADLILTLREDLRCELPADVDSL